MREASARAICACYPCQYFKHHAHRNDEGDVMRHNMPFAPHPTRGKEHWLVLPSGVCCRPDGEDASVRTTAATTAMQKSALPSRRRDCRRAR